MRPVALNLVYKIILGVHNLDLVLLSEYKLYMSSAALAISSRNLALGISFLDVIVNWRRSGLTCQHLPTLAGDNSLTVITGHIRNPKTVGNHLLKIKITVAPGFRSTHLAPTIHREMLREYS